MSNPCPPPPMPFTSAFRGAPPHPQPLAGAYPAVLVLCCALLASSMATADDNGAADNNSATDQTDEIVLPPPIITEQTRGPDPKACRVILEDMGEVGYRISDAQALASDALTQLRTRLGQEAVSYEGLLKNHKQMRKMLGKRSETKIQKEQIKYLEDCAKHAPYRVSVRFGTKRKMQFLHLGCSLANSKKALVERKMEARYFEDLRARLNEALPDFCPQLAMPPAEALPTAAEEDTQRKGKSKRAKKEKKQRKEAKKSRAELRADEADAEEAYDQETVLPKKKQASDKWLVPPRR